MGNRVPSRSRSHLVDSKGQKEAGAASGSGMYLSPALQAEINADFEAQIIQKEWDKYRILHLQKHEQRTADSALHIAEIEEKIENLQSQAAEVHAKLDEMVSAAESKLVSLELEVGHDAERVRKKFEGGLAGGAPAKGACLDVRAELSQCYASLKDTGECQIFANKLEKCVTEAP